MARATEDDAAGVAVLGGIAGRVVSRSSRLGDLVIEHAVAFLLNVKMVVAVEHGMVAVFDEELVDRRGPAGAVLAEAVGGVEILAAPFEECGRLGSAAAFRRRTANQVVDENKLVGSPTRPERACQPPILLLAKRPLPVVASAMDSLREPERVKRDEQGVAPLPRVVILEQAGFPVLRCVARVEVVRYRVWEISLARQV